MKNARRIGTKLDLATLAIASVLSVGVLGASIASAAEPTAPTSERQAPERHARFDRCDRILALADKMDKKLSTEQVRDIVAGRLAQNRDHTLKVGKATAKGDGVVAVEILTTSGSLVTTRDISTKTGGPARMEQSCREKVASADGKGRMDGMRHGRWGHGMRGAGLLGGLATLAPEGARDLNLTTDQVKKLADAALILTGNPRLKVGPVKEKDANTITVDIVTTDNALVMHREIDRDTGRVRRSI
jgi:hypothetical protein